MCVCESVCDLCLSSLSLPLPPNVSTLPSTPPFLLFLGSQRVEVP